MVEITENFLFKPLKVLCRYKAPIELSNYCFNWDSSLLCQFYTQKDTKYKETSENKIRTLYRYKLAA
jgi:hypothetical protein